MPLCGTDEASNIKLDDTIGKPKIETMPLKETDEALDATQLMMPMVNPTLR
jgi:hypothetical protein